MQYLSKALFAKKLGAKIMELQDAFGKTLNEGTEFKHDGSHIHALFNDGDAYTIGTLTVSIMAIPAIPPRACACAFGEAAFVGDTLFKQAYDDFLGGVLFDTIQNVLALTDAMRLLMCHDYGPNGCDI